MEMLKKKCVNLKVNQWGCLNRYKGKRVFKKWTRNLCDDIKWFNIQAASEKEGRKNSKGKIFEAIIGKSFSNLLKKQKFTNSGCFVNTY